MHPILLYIKQATFYLTNYCETYLEFYAFREESFIASGAGGGGWGGGRLHFHVVGKNFDDPPIPLYDKNVCDPPPTPAQPPKTPLLFFLLL